MYSELSISLYLALFILSVAAAPPPGPVFKELGAVVGGEGVRNAHIDKEMSIAIPVINYNIPGTAVVG